MQQEQNIEIENKKKKQELFNKLNNRYRTEIEPNKHPQFYHKQSTYEITKELEISTLGYTKEMWKNYVVEQNKIIEENKKNEEVWRLKSIEEEKRINKEREEITKDFFYNLTKEELEIYESTWKDCEGSYSYVEVPYEE